MGRQAADWGDVTTLRSVIFTKEEGNNGANKIFVYKRKLVSRFLHENAHLRLRWWMDHLAAVLYHIASRGKWFFFLTTATYTLRSLPYFILLDESEERSAERLIMCSKLQILTSIQLFASVSLR